jgi:hypothetical protein
MALTKTTLSSPSLTRNAVVVRRPLPTFPVVVRRPISRAIVVRCLRPPPSSAAIAVFRCRHLRRSHHCHSAVSAVSRHPLSSFPIIVRRTISGAVVIRRRRRPPPSSSAVAVVVRRCGLPPSQPSSPLSCLWRLSPPSSLPHCSPPPDFACLRRPLPIVAAAVVSSDAPFN